MEQVESDSSVLGAGLAAYLRCTSGTRIPILAGRSDRTGLVADTDSVRLSLRRTGDRSERKLSDPSDSSVSRILALR